MNNDIAVRRPNTQTHKFVSGRLYMQNGKMKKIKFKEIKIWADDHSLISKLLTFDTTTIHQPFCHSNSKTMNHFQLKIPFIKNKCLIIISFKAREYEKKKLISFQAKCKYEIKKQEKKQIEREQKRSQNIMYMN